jgi:2-oxoglutarate dehydrogenase E1 component
VDLIGFRRHGHSEVDDPTITQPLLYRKIKDHAQLWQIYADSGSAWTTRKRDWWSRYAESTKPRSAVRA